MKAIHIILVFISIGAASCKEETTVSGSGTEASSADSVSNGTANGAEGNMLALDTFARFPSEIDGCACYFSRDSVAFNEGIYVYVNDFAQTSFIKLNGSFVKFIQADYKKEGTKTWARSKSENCKMEIELQELRSSGDESQLMKGVLKIEDASGKQVELTVYGECGC